MRLVRDEVIYLHGNYKFRSREEMLQAIAAARELILNGSNEVPLSLQCNVIADTELQIVVKVPFFEESDFAATFFGLLSRCASGGQVEARVDVL